MDYSVGPLPIEEQLNMNRKNYRKTQSSRKRTILKVIVTLAVSLLICISAYGIYLVKKAESAVDSAYEAAGPTDEPVDRLLTISPSYSSESMTAKNAVKAMIISDPMHSFWRH